MRFIPYSRQDIDEADRAAVLRVLGADFVTQGPEIQLFEEAFAEKHEVAHAMAVSNATAGLHIACLAFDIGPGSLVWTVPNSFVASANCALYCGADVDFVDIDPLTRNLSVEALTEKLAAADRAGRLPDLLIPVDFAGIPCDLADIRQLADRYGFKILQDASHATGAAYQGRPVGGQYADACVFSFHAVKIVTTGEGGMITTQDDRLAARMAMLRTHGITRDPEAMEDQSQGAWYFEQQELGYNYRMTDIQAALGRSQLERLEPMAAARSALARRYLDKLAGLPLLLPHVPQDRQASWHLFAVQLSDEARCTRAALFAQLREAGIGVNVHYIPIHLQPFYRRRGFKPGDFPAAEAFYDRALSIPLFPALTHEDQDRVIDELRTRL
ncbi:MAG TPA: UDP-4-amino-4,6-dideoxy-N-acetyl-beta-L-altrosamine transaminase [Sphingomonas sp.]|nr:UDP-4-amino-4,6-dideoxy-N-acetyl-beta-L-altrosamine transaminase [Sphingomonas sp.]